MGLRERKMRKLGWEEMSWEKWDGEVGWRNGDGETGMGKRGWRRRREELGLTENKMGKLE